jgi:hypothetical protein
MERFKRHKGCDVQLEPGFYTNTKGVNVLVDLSDTFTLINTEPEYVHVFGHGTILKVHYRSIRKIMK